MVSHPRVGPEVQPGGSALEATIGKWMMGKVTADPLGSLSTAQIPAPHPPAFFIRDQASSHGEQEARMVMGARELRMEW